LTANGAWSLQNLALAKRKTVPASRVSARFNIRYHIRFSAKKQVLAEFAAKQKFYAQKFTQNFVDFVLWQLFQLNGII